MLLRKCLKVRATLSQIISQIPSANSLVFITYEVRLKSIETVCFARATITIVIKALFFKVVQCPMIVKMQFQHSVTIIPFFTGFLKGTLL